MCCRLRRQRRSTTRRKSTQRTTRRRPSSSSRCSDPCADTPSFCVARVRQPLWRSSCKVEVVPTHQPRRTSGSVWQIHVQVFRRWPRISADDSPIVWPDFPMTRQAVKPICCAIRPITPGSTEAFTPARLLINRTHISQDSTTSAERHVISMPRTSHCQEHLRPEQA